MASLAHAIHGVQNGTLSHYEFLEQVDRLLEEGRTDSSQLQDLLNEERTRILLPPDVYEELRHRAGQGPPPGVRRPPDHTVAQTGPGGRSIPMTVPPTMSWRGDVSGEPEKMKGVGDTLNGRFVLEECIGFGGMGMVYKALDLRKLEASDRNPYIAIKVLNVQFRGHPKSLIALQREAKKAQTLAHPNIVTVYDFDRDGQTVYLTMEYLSGEPLSRMLRHPDFRGLPLADTQHIVTGMARALAYAHERGFVHCDFKPANVILTDAGDVKVIDFGIARAIRKPSQESEVTVFDPGSLGGLTPAYASPEMLEHRDPDPRDDIYALACITYELLTGKHPFDRLTASQARNAAMKPQRPKDLGQRQWKALRSALAFEREARTPTVARFLEEFGDGRKTANRQIMIAGGAVAAVLALAVAGYYAVSRNGYPGVQTAAVASGDSGAQNVPQAAPRVAPLSMEEVERTLAKVPCSALLASSSEGRLQVRGYLSAGFGIPRLRETLGNLPGVQSVQVEAQQLADDKCGVVGVLAPYWQQNMRSGAAAAVHTKPPDAPLREGDALVLDVATPPYDSHVNIDYYSFDGGVVHLVPSPRARANQAPPSYAATIGSTGNWVVSKPLGTDLIVLLITPVPLFDGLRPEAERTQDYLPVLERQLARMGEQYGRDKIVADFLQITTRPRNP
jgi:serine/threonine protein kinase